ncbi:MAG TPA: isocitrate lyase/phosphoenolpyruvate mutase family protein, partial [Burkholderiaceae bacterium]
MATRLASPSSSPFPHSLRQQHADTLHRLHANGAKPLVLVNAWDAASARLLERAGSSVIATTSAGMAWSLGHADGEQLPGDELVAACARICRVAGGRLPVSVDIERGYGRDADEVCALVRTLIGL